MTQDITVTDLFCGAGGSSIGAEAAGARLKMAANHWRLAIDTHNSNFPNADHDCADVSQVNPRRYPSTDILIASPECTNHSSAKSNKVVATIWEQNPKGLLEAERSRATMWDVPRFAETHKYAMIVVENVVEARNWVMFDAWLQAMHALGYDHKPVFMNSMTAYPTPQSRDRMYVIFWRRGNTTPDLRFDTPAFCTHCAADVQGIQVWKNPAKPFGKYRTQYIYACPRCAKQAIPYAYPAASAIDWSLDAPRIGDRAKPLAPATMRRIEAGLRKYGPAAIVQAAGHTFERPGYFRTWPTTLPIPAQTTTAQHALVMDMNYKPGIMLDMSHGAEASDANKVRSTDEPMFTQTTQQSHGLIVPMRNHGKASPVSDPVNTVSAEGNHHALLIRNFTPRGNPAQMAKPVSSPMGALTAHDHTGLMTMPFTVPYYGTGVADPVSEPISAQTARARHGLVEPGTAVEDCGFRMLEPHEIGRAMAFPDTYKVLGNKRERVRQYGNAVTPPAMSLLLERCIRSLQPA